MIERYFSVPAKLNYHLVFHRLEFRNKTTDLSSSEVAKYRDQMDRLLPTLLPHVCFTILPISSNDGKTLIAGSLSLESASACKLTQNSKRLVVMASTSPSSDSLLEQAKSEGNLAKAAFIDAVASEVADAGLDWLEGLLTSRLKREGAFLTMRFSAGYGDVPLSLQKPFFDLLELDKLSVSLNDRFMLTPQKSVIAFAGIEG